MTRCVILASTAFVDTTTTATLVASPQTPGIPKKLRCVHKATHDRSRRGEKCRSMKKTREKHLRLSEEEFEQLQMKARAACMSDSAFIRQLITGYVPVAAPDERFYKVMDFMREFADRVDVIALKADSSVDMIAIMNEARKWRAFQNAIEKAFLRPKRGDG